MTPATLKAKEFEELCLYRMQKEAEAGRATMSRYGVQGVFIDDKWQPIQSLPDFEGVVIGGRQFIIEAKVCSQASFPLDDDKFKKRQLKHLLTRARFGVVAILLIHWNARELIKASVPAITYAMPVRSDMHFWQGVDRAEIKRMSRDDCDEYGVKVAWDIAERGRTPRPNILQAVLQLSELLTLVGRQ